MHIAETNFSNPYNQKEHFRKKRLKKNKNSISKIVDLFELSHDYQKEIEIIELEFVSSRIFQLPKSRNQKILEAKQKLGRRFYWEKTVSTKIVDRLITEYCP